MPLSHKKQNKGFTLIETLVTVFIFVIIMGGTTLLLRDILKSSGQEPLALEAIDQARLAVFNFANEIRNANVGENGAYPLIQADDAQITFYSATKKIKYFVSDTTLYKNVIVNGSEATTTVITNLANATVPVFKYYNENYVGSSAPLAQTVNINNVKFVSMNLIIPTQDVREATTTFTITSGGTIRNLKNNSAN